MTPEQIEEIAKKAAKEALEELFLIMGINITSKDGLIEAQKDWTYTRESRLGKDELVKKGKLTLVGVFVAGIAGIIVKAIFGHG